MKRPIVTAILSVIPFTLGACSSNGDHGGMGTEQGTTVTPATADEQAAAFNDADVAFAQGMVPHHEQAVEMAELAVDPARKAGPDVVDLATRIEAAQGPEIELMSGWLQAWGQSDEMDMSGDDMGSMDGMMTEDQLETLATATESEFDRMWLEMMTAHHEGAVAMAETEQADGSNPEAVALAWEIIASQQVEIEEMQELLAG